MTLSFSPGLFLITGASSGIGAAAATLLARSGVKVVLAARRLERCERLAHQLREEGLWAQARALDITDAASVHALISELSSTSEGLSGALNNAARLESAAPLTEMDPAQAQATWDTNIHAQLTLLQAEIRAMAGRGGSIVSVGSIAGQLSLYNLAPYAASKAALRSLVRSAAAGAFPQGVRVNLLSPGPTHTEMGHDAYGSDRNLDAAMAASPAGRGALPEEIAQAALWLLSEQAGFVNGAELVVDGGHSL